VVSDIADRGGMQCAGRWDKHGIARLMPAALAGADLRS